MTQMGKWFEFKPLDALIQKELAHRDVGLHAWCEERGLCSRTIYRARMSGRIKWDHADRIACALYLHPLLVWPTWVSAPEVQDVEKLAA